MAIHRLIKTTRNHHGQTLIESLVALGIIIVVMSAIGVVIATSLYNSQFVRDQNLANKYSQQGMELIRNIQQGDISSFASLDGNGYCIDGALILPSSDPKCSNDLANIGNMYRRINFDKDEVTCNPGGALPNQPQHTKVIVITSWTSSKCSSGVKYCHDSAVESCLPYTSGINP